MKRNFVIKGYYSQTDNEKYYVIERKILGIFSSKYMVPLFYSGNNDRIVAYTEYSFSDPNKAIDVLQHLERFEEENKNGVQIAWDFGKDIYVYIPENNLDHMIGYDEILDKDLVFANPLDAVIKYNEIEEHKKYWIEKTVTFKNGEIH